MKCFKHNAVDAVAVCAFCGRAMCPECLPAASSSPLACTTGCADQLTRQAEAIQTLLERSRQSARASALYCYLSGGLSAGAAVAASFMLPSPFLVWFAAGCAVALLSAGFWHGRVARSASRRDRR
ncbi:MAG: hypothetical protein ABSH48_22275 [Verrucomicrobiota bacterium]|jgi:hypothetical protein